MARAPFQVLVFPFRRTDGGVIEYAIFRRSDPRVWQGIAGGGEDGEGPEVAAAREAYEEAGIPKSAPLERLASTGAIAVEHFGARDLWGATLRTIPEFSFGIEVGERPITLTNEHSEVVWLEFDAALDHLEWESNRVALGELHTRLRNR